jgi:glycosyl transferase, family 25
MKVYFINLDRSQDRRKHIESNLRKLGVDAERVSAIDGKTLTKEYISEVYNEKKCLKKHRKKLTPNEIGCALSHLKIYKNIVKNNLDGAMILEDDVKLDNRFVSAIKQIEKLKKLDSKSSAVILLNQAHQIFTWSGKLDYNIYKTYKSLLAMSYYITQEGAKNMLLSFNPIDQAIDSWYQLSKDKIVTVYSFYPGITCFSSFHSDSDIGEVNKPNQRNWLHKQVRKVRQYLQRKILYKIPYVFLGLKKL